MKRLTIMLVIILSLTALSTVQAKGFSKKDFLKMGATENICSVTAISRTGFVGRCGENEIRFQTSNATIFGAYVEKLQHDDTINVTYYAPEDGSGNIFNYQVALIELIQKSSLKPVRSPQVGIYTSYQGRVKRAIYFPEEDRLVTMERAKGHKLIAGKEYLFTFDVIPANIGNGYVYVIHEVDPITSE